MQKFLSSNFGKAFSHELLCVGGCGQWVKLGPELPLSKPAPVSQDISSPAGSPALTPTPPPPAPLSPGLKESFSAGCPDPTSPVPWQDRQPAEWEMFLQAPRCAPKQMGCHCQQPAPRSPFSVTSAPENTSSQNIFPRLLQPCMLPLGSLLHFLLSFHALAWPGTAKMHCLWVRICL